MDEKGERADYKEAQRELESAVTKTVSILRLNGKSGKPTGRAHLIGCRLPKLHLKKSSPQPSRWKFPTKRMQWPRARLTKPRADWRRARRASAPARARRRGGNAEVPAPQRGRLTNVPLNGDLLDACPLRAGGGRRTEPLGWGGHACWRRLGRGSCRRTATAPGAPGCSVTLAPAGPAL